MGDFEVMGVYLSSSSLCSVLENSEENRYAGVFEIWGFGFGCGGGGVEDERWWRWRKMVAIYIYIVCICVCVLCEETAEKDERNEVF